MTMTAKDILNAIHKKYPANAIVSELVVDDIREREKRARYYEKQFPDYTPSATWDRSIFAGVELEEVSFRTPSERRIDALMRDTKHYTAIEIKVSRADFKRESEQKRFPWRNLTHKFVYAAPKGLLLPEMMPDWCGLWEVDERGRVTTAKRAVVNKNPSPFPRQLQDALLYRCSNQERAKLAGRG